MKQKLFYIIKIAENGRLMMQKNEMDMGRKLKRTQGHGIQVAVSTPAQMSPSIAPSCPRLSASAAFVPVSL